MVNTLTKKRDVFHGAKPLKTPSTDTTLIVSKKVHKRHSMHVVIGLSFFLCSLVVSIVTLLFVRKDTIPPHLVVASVDDTAVFEDFTYGPQPRLMQEDFFKETEQKFITEKISFIKADLSAMRVYYYREGSVLFEAPILSKGKEGSWWETPAGLYKIESKTPNHFSSFGRVYQPWSMIFQGNFFIHGWPYYPNGTPVSSQFSGGCIRLADADAEALYAFVDVATPVLVYEDDYTSDGFLYDAQTPQIDATAYLIADVQNGTILVEEHDGETLLPIASITKLMTALVATEYINLDKEILIPSESLVNTSVPRLVAGERVTTYSLLFPLLLESSNEAAEALAILLGKEYFVSLMNKKAWALGMDETVFTDVSGVDAGNVSTPRDLLRLITYLYNNRSFLLQISSGNPVVGAYDKHTFGTLSNFNETPGLGGLIGGKVGKTTVAKETSLVLHTVDIKGVPRPVAFVVLGATDRFDAVTKLYKYVSEQYGSLAPAHVIP